MVIIFLSFKQATNNLVLCFSIYNPFCKIDFFIIISIPCILNRNVYILFF